MGSLEEGQEALKNHIREKALAARAKAGGRVDADTIIRFLEDPAVVRFPTELRFSKDYLKPGEFAYAEPIDGGSRRYVLWIHPFFEPRPEVWPLLIAYHITTINYGSIVTHEEAELYGATLLGMDIDDYYQTLCDLVDGMDPEATEID